MNRLVIIGNGFDLAHGLPTSYRDFIDDYWTNIKDSNHDELVSFELDDLIEFQNHKTLNDLIEKIINIDVKFKREGIDVYKLKEHLIPLANNRISVINYKNRFFQLINHEAIENWVDIENLYFEILKEIFNKKNNRYSGNINQLNKDFEQIKNYLVKYLNKISNQGDYMDREIYETKAIFENLYYENEELNSYLQEFPEIDHDDLKRDNEIVKNHLFANKGRINELTRDQIVENQLYFLSFNYTYLSNRYVNKVRNYDVNSSNYIHGMLNYEGINPINFGFGDEMNEHYNAIENININEYLKNFKSFQYLQNSNYRSLLQFIETKKFQVFIMGHSCGLSDRTLLNTIFEHENCRSIKIFYYEERDEKGNKIKDNYTEITQNISRHFEDKKLMREKIVNKTLCVKLPQIQLPKKQ